jgi:hypothetical protein
VLSACASCCRSTQISVSEPLIVCGVVRNRNRKPFASLFFLRIVAPERSRSATRAMDRTPLKPPRLCTPPPGRSSNPLLCTRGGSHPK